MMPPLPASDHHMISRLSSSPLVRHSSGWLTRLRGRVRASEILFVAVAIAIGMVAGGLTVVQGKIARALQHLLFGFPSVDRLSALPVLPPIRLLVLPIGGLVVAGFSLAVRARRRNLVDAVEANALHGGRMDVGDSLVVSAQTILSNGFGASVGLEAAYAQLAAVAASVSGRWLNLRRADQRILVGAGAGAAIAAAFGAPLAGAFYAFEIVIGVYTPSAIAPVVAASLAGAQVAQRLGSVPYIVAVPPGPAIHVFGYVVYAGLGLACAMLGIALMRGVAIVEAGSRRWLRSGLRPAAGGLLLMPLALVSSQVLSAGHGALHLDLVPSASLGFIALILACKSLASIVSLGFGFRGGLFFASLFLGTLVGHLYAGAAAAIAGVSILNPDNAAMVGMAALAVAVVGGPFTMAMLVLEATGNFSLTGAVLAAALVSSTMVRELFGYSFSTWRLHLRGETIKSARDVGWVKTLTAGRMMRRETQTVSPDTTVAEFRRRFPLGSTSRVVLADEQRLYAGIVVPAAAYAEDTLPGMPVAALAVAREKFLTPELDINEVMQAFDEAQADELAVVDAEGRVLGTLSDKFVRRRYADELEARSASCSGRSRAGWIQFWWTPSGVHLAALSGSASRRATDSGSANNGDRPNSRSHDRSRRHG
jgi:CIC family chloride channel protein